MTADLRDPAPHPEAAAGPGEPVRAGWRPEVVLVRVLPGARHGLHQGQAGRQSRGPREGRQDRCAQGPCAGSHRVPRRRGDRLGQPRAARGLRAPRALEGARPRRREAGLVDRVLRGRPPGARPGRGERRCWPRRSTTRATTARRCSRLIRSTSTGERIPSANAYTGTLSMFERAGFKEVERRQANSSVRPRPIVRRAVRPRPG